MGSDTAVVAKRRQFVIYVGGRPGALHRSRLRRRDDGARLVERGGPTIRLALSEIERALTEEVANGSD